jgi:hypothetical protein
MPDAVLEAGLRSFHREQPGQRGVPAVDVQT